MKGLASSVKGFIDHAFSLNYLLSINPEIVEHVAAAHKDWSKRVSRIVSDALSGNSGMAENVRLDGQSSTIYYEPIRLPGNESNDHYSLLLIRDNSSLTRAKLTIWMAILFVRFPPGASYS
ncbi:hypothetical protein D1BOALGB6SA_385 [Olavius sp. associated proteobacterium Delta 1]|nr:hypothetical protein D1BOALGB6SA_385 [Olavius sp. associated proteobacterium Delta 1]